MAAGDLIVRSSQIEWSGLLLGDGTNYYVDKLDGWRGLPPVDSGNVPKAGAHGSWSGRPLAQERVVTVEFSIRPDGEETEALVAAVEAACPLGDGTELPLVVRPYGTPILMYAQVHRLALPMDLGYRRWVKGCAIQWVCSDPARYSVSEQSITIAAPTLAVGGLDWPLEYPLDWGTPGVPGVGTATNTGSSPTSPRLVFTGPVTTPNVLNFLTGQMLEFDVDVPAGVQLIVDTAAGTVLMNGASLVSSLTNASVPLASWTLQPGANPLVYRGAAFDGEGSTLTVFWRSAF